jgi:hypothetical protein
MKKTYYLLLLLPLLFLTACSYQKSNDATESQDLVVVTDQPDIFLEEDGEDIEETEDAIVNDNNIVYQNNDYGFKLFMPLSWQRHLVRTDVSGINYHGKMHDAAKVVFGFPIKIAYNQETNVISAENCEDCFQEIFRLTIYTKEVFQELNRDNDLVIAREGESVFTDLGKIVGENEDYIFVVPKNIHGQSYDGQFIYDRQTEAATFLSYLQTY